jgi:TPR repeat protein
MMNHSRLRKFVLFVVVVTLGLSASQSAEGGFKEGLDSYDRNDYATALKEWKPLAEQGDAGAQYYLGVMYAYGQGVPQDQKTGVKWYALAAEQGNAFAQSNLGFMYAKGRGILQDYKTAVKWFTFAAEQGYVRAQSNLGLMYTKGQGVPQDYVYAHMWINIAASSGNKDALKNRDIIAKRMTPSQIENAQRLARECVRKKYKGC